MPTAQHWRLVIPSTASGYAELTEVAFLNAAGTDLSVGGTASASSEFSGTYSAAKAFDKSDATSWSSTFNSFPAYIQYDHGAPVDVEGIRILFTNLSGVSVNMGSLRVRYSSDATTWSDEMLLKVGSGLYAPTSAVALDFGLYALSDVQTVLQDVVAFVSTPTLSGLNPIFFPDALHLYRDFEFGGFGRIAGTVKKDASPDLPVKRRVRLHRETDGLLVREVWSDAATGAYSFDYIDETKVYTVITYDYLHDYRAVIADNITPEPMP